MCLNNNANIFYIWMCPSNAIRVRFYQIQQTNKHLACTNLLFNEVNIQPQPVMCFCYRIPCSRFYYNLRFSFCMMVIYAFMLYSGLHLCTHWSRDSFGVSCDSFVVSRDASNTIYTYSRLVNLLWRKLILKLHASRHPSFWKINYRRIKVNRHLVHFSINPFYNMQEM